MYRCPVCASSPEFTTLEGLSIHLDMEHFASTTDQSRADSRRIEAELETILDLELTRRHNVPRTPHIEVKCIHRNPIAEKRSALVSEENDELRTRMNQLQNDLREKSIQLIHQQKDGNEFENDARQLAKFIKRCSEDQLRGRQRVEDLILDLVEEIDKLEARLNETPIFS